MREPPVQAPPIASPAERQAASRSVVPPPVQTPSSPEGPSLRRWLGPLIALAAVIVFGLVLHHKLRSQVWAYFTDGEGMRVSVTEKRERMVLWEDPQQHVFENSTGAEPEEPIKQRVEAAFSADGTTMVLTRWTKRRSSSDADLYLSNWDGRTWSRPEPIAGLNTRSNERGAAFSRDGKYLYFSSDREGGAGGFDLYVARSDGNKWTAVTSLGASINSVHNESGPAPSAEGERLYFSSDRNTTNDTQDIFVAKLVGTKPLGNRPPVRPNRRQGFRRETPVGLSPVPVFGQAELVADLSSPADDIEAALTSRGNYVFLSSDRHRSSRSGFNLYVSSVIDGKIQSPQKVDVYVRSGNATDPAVRMEGFDLLFSADGDLTTDTNKVESAQAKPGPVYRLYRSTTREVIGYTDVSRWELFKELVHKIQWLILLAIVSLVCLIYLLEKWRDITSLFHKCLAASGGAHLLLLMFMTFWLITQAIEEEEAAPAVEVAVSVDALAQEELAMESEQELAEVMDATQMAVTKSEQALPEAPQQVVENAVAVAQQTFDESLVSDIKQTQASEAIESEPILQPTEQASKLVELNPIELPVSAAEAMESAELPSENVNERVDQAEDNFQPSEVAIQQVESQKANVAEAANNQLDVQTDTDSVARSDAMSEAPESQSNLVEPIAGLEAIEPSLEIASSIAPIELSAVAFESMETAEVPSESSAQPVDTTNDDFQSDAVAVQQVESQKADVGQATSSQLDVQAESQSVARSDGMTDSPEAQSDLVQPTAGFEAIEQSLEIVGSIAPANLPDIALEAMETAEVPSDSAVQPADTARDDFQSDAVAVQQVESQKADVGRTTISQLDVPAESESAASSSAAIEALVSRDLIQPSSSVEAVDATSELAGSIAPVALSVVAIEAMESAETRSDSTAGRADTTLDDFQPDAMVVQQVESSKADVAQTTGREMDVQADSESAAPSDGVASTFNPQGDSIQPNSGLEATGSPSELAANAPLAGLGANLPGGDAIEFLPGESLEAPENLNIGAISKHIKQQRGNLSNEMVEQLGGSEGTEGAIGLGLNWFTDHQESEGHWEMSKYLGDSKDNIAGAGLALLCYYGWGIKHGSYGVDNKHDHHSQAVTKALAWLLKQQEADGSLLGSPTNHGMYCHGIASVALCEGFSLTKDPKLKEAASKAIDYILKSQHEGGGWRYRPRERGDLSVTGWQYLALHSARMADIPVPDEAFTKTGKFLDGVSGGTHGGYYGYLLPEKDKPTMTATGMFLRQLDGASPLEPHMQESAQVLKSRMLTPESIDFYYDYYATLALYQHQGPIWQEWNANLKEVYTTLQKTTGPQKGSWDSKGSFVKAGGRVVSTGLAILNLEVYYRLLPMHGHDRPQDQIAAP